MSHNTCLCLDRAVLSSLVSCFFSAKKLSYNAACFCLHFLGVQNFTNFSEFLLVLKATQTRKRLVQRENHIRSISTNPQILMTKWFPYICSYLFIWQVLRMIYLTGPSQGLKIRGARSNVVVIMCPPCPSACDSPEPQSLCPTHYCLSPRFQKAI